VTEPFAFADDLGPEKVIEIYDPGVGLKAVLVVDNVAIGPSIGGVRMAQDVTVSECFRLARAMTLKNAMAGLEHGGGKSVIVADPAMDGSAKERLVRSFAYAVKDVLDYIPGPDMGTNERAMAWVKDVIGRAAGLPREIGGIPLDEIGATGLGVASAADVAQGFCDVVVAEARVVVQGFGSVGMHAARFLAQKGARLVGVSDSRGARAAAEGFDVDALMAFKLEGNSVADFPVGERIDRDAVVDVDCEIWIPAARPDVVRLDNVDRLNARLVVQGANIPVTPDAERSLAHRGVLVIPDFVANAGGVICAAVEYHGGDEAQALATIDEKIRANVREVLETARTRDALPRQVASEIAVDRVRRAMASRRTY
jgi:glutamate dehydrogenase/leucine dehydrogenase